MWQKLDYEECIIDMYGEKKGFLFIRWETWQQQKTPMSDKKFISMLALEKRTLMVTNGEGPYSGDRFDRIYQLWKTRIPHDDAGEVPTTDIIYVVHLKE